MGLTCHRDFVFKEEFGRYAKSKGILLIPGVELSIKRLKHVVVLNCKKDIENVYNFADLRLYKRRNPKIFVLAPHPFFPSHVSLRNDFYKNVDLFDAIEFSWFWTKKMDFNKEAESAALFYKKPYIATSDTHSLKYIDKAYAIIEAKENSIEAVLGAIKSGSFKNYSSPLSRPDLLKVEMLVLHSYFGGRLRGFKNGVKKSFFKK